MAVENDVRIWAQDGKIYMTGNITDERHRDLFIAKLRLDKPEPTFRQRIKRFFVGSGKRCPRKIRPVRMRAARFDALPERCV